jgi:diaminohydroxyphosphoribosylaminopyrimidine deaminase / 5-amino-6-(5-phosphoribosylamino)uracil reductase
LAKKSAICCHFLPKNSSIRCSNKFFIAFDIYRLREEDPELMSAHSTDEQFLRRAIDLARRGIGLASPNPYVGAVITDTGGEIAGTGTHTYAGVKHAEVIAIEAARDKTLGGTLYINLEPCSHQGRTPPCADAVIAAGIRRVVASMADPNPRVSGRGFEKLRAAGIQVKVGGLEDEARSLNESFARYIRNHTPLVTLKSAMTLDGKIAPSPATMPHPPAKATFNEFSGTWITGEAARAHVHELRHRHDAILAGIGTVLADNPLFTDRSGHSRRRPLLRVILDSQLRLPMDSRLVQDGRRENRNDVLIFCASADDEKKSQLEQFGIRVEKVSAVDSQGRPEFSAILRRLGELEITSLMIEGGSAINGAALAAGIVDKVFLYYAPKVFGENGAVPFASDPDSRTIRGAIQAKSMRLHRFEEDFAVEGYLRDPYND